MRGRRIGAFVIDFAIMAAVVVAVRSSTDIASAGHTALHAALMLVKDVAGASPGKWLLGLRVVAEAGGAASVPRRIVRNVTLLVFLLDFEHSHAPVRRLANGFAGLVWVIEVLLVLTEHDRLGDWLAGTRVVAAPARATSAG